MSTVTTTPTQKLTHSRLSTFRECPRRHEISYELQIRPEIEPFYLRVGSAFHAALEAKDKGIDPSLTLEERVKDPFDLAMVAAMFDGHERRWPEPLEVVASEIEFDLPLMNPATGKSTPIWRMAGKIDRIVRLRDGRLALQEYKTTERDFAPGEDYWVRLHLDQQLSIYVLAARRMGYDIDTILYDVTRRPRLRPFKATPVELRKYVQKTGALYANQRAEDETAPEFAARVATDIMEKPDYYFARIEIARLDQDLDDCAYELWQQQLAIREAQRAGRWYRNPNACISATGVSCQFLTICMNRDLAERTPQGFVRLNNPHPELAQETDEQLFARLS